MINATVKVDTRGIRIMASELSRASGQPYEKILRLEAASIIKICALRADVASVANIQRAVEKAALGSYTSPDHSIVTVNSIKNKGRTWFVPGDKGPERGPGGTFYMVYAAGHARGHHLPDFYWQAFLLAVDDQAGYIKARIAELKKRRGLQRMSWLQISDALGVPLSTVGPQGNLQEGLVRAARGPRGRVFANGKAVRSESGAMLAFTVTNYSPLAIKRQGQSSIDRAANQRLTGFRIAVSKGVLDDMTARSARWPGVFVSQR